MNNVEFLRNLENRYITLNDWCEAYYNAKVLLLPIEEHLIFKKITEKAIEILPKYPYNGRINEFGNHMENVLIEAIQIVLDIEEVVNLGSGYPDIHFSLNGKDYYPECKVSGIKTFDKPSSFRMFYTSAPSEKTKKMKNIKDGHHLLFHFEHNMKKNGIGSLTGRFKITDLDGFVYKSESIQQGSAKDLYKSHKKVIVESK